jgi:hypothetical protein
MLSPAFYLERSMASNTDNSTFPKLPHITTTKLPYVPLGAAGHVLPWSDEEHTGNSFIPYKEEERKRQIEELKKMMSPHEWKVELKHSNQDITLEPYKSIDQSRVKKIFPQVSAAFVVKAEDLQRDALFHNVRYVYDKTLATLEQADLLKADTTIFLDTTHPLAPHGEDWARGLNDALTAKELRLDCAAVEFKGFMSLQSVKGVLAVIRLPGIADL